MYQDEASSACSFLSLPGTSRSLGCQWDGVARQGGGLSPESFPCSQCRGSHRLTHLCLLPGTAARQLRLFGVTAVPPRRAPHCTSPPVSPTRGRFGVKQPLGTPAVALAMPAPMCSHPTSMRWHSCHQPQHTRATTLLAPGTGRHRPGVCGTLVVSLHPGVGIRGGHRHI